MVGRHGGLTLRGLVTLGLQSGSRETNAGAQSPLAFPPHLQGLRGAAPETSVEYAGRRLTRRHTRPLSDLSPLQSFPLSIHGLQGQF